LTETGFWSKAKPESNPSCCCARADHFTAPNCAQETKPPINSDTVTVFECKTVAGPCYSVALSPCHCFSTWYVQCCCTHRDSSFLHWSFCSKSHQHEMRILPRWSNGVVFARDFQALLSSSYVQVLVPTMALPWKMKRSSRFFGKPFAISKIQ
jgi:hypothetical protein